MPTIRLTNNHRRAIHRRLTHGKFDAEQKKIDDLSGELGMAIYREILGKDFNKLQKLPENWFGMKADILVMFGGETVSLRLPKKSRFPKFMNHYGIVAKFDGRHEYTKRHQKIAALISDLEKKKAALNAQIEGVLFSATTLNKLCELWPEVCDLAREVVKAPVATNLPAIQFDKLNKQLGLKGKAK